MSEDAYARKEGFPTKVIMIALAAIVIVLWLFFGYAYFTSPMPESSIPPRLWLEYEGELYSGIQGSYCWADECVNIEFQEPAGTVYIVSGSSVGLLLNSTIKPNIVHADIFAIDRLGNPLPIGQLTNRGNEQYTVDLLQGTYVLQLKAIWENVGEVSYLFRIIVD